MKWKGENKLPAAAAAAAAAAATLACRFSSSVSVSQGSLDLLSGLKVITRASSAICCLYPTPARTSSLAPNNNNNKELGWFGTNRKRGFYS